MPLAERLVRNRATAVCAWCGDTFSLMRRDRRHARRYGWEVRNRTYCDYGCYREFMKARRLELAAKPKAPQGPLLAGELTKDELRFAAEIAELEIEAERPRNRLECADGPRPCPWVSCRYNLYLDVTPSTGSIRVNLPIAVEDMKESCVLDFDERPQSQDQIGDLFGLSRQRVQQIEQGSLDRLIKRHAR